MGGFVYWPRESYNQRDYPIITVSSGRARGRQSGQVVRGGSSTRQRRQSPAPVVNRGNANRGRGQNRGNGRQSVRQRGQQRPQEARRGRAESQPAAARRSANPRVDEASRRVDTTRNQIARVRSSLGAARPSLAGSRDAARVSDVLSPSADREEDADGADGNGVDDDAASMSSGLINEFLGMILDDE